MGKIILSVFVMMSTSVFAGDLKEDKIAQCIEKESAVIRKEFSAHCGVAENLLIGNGSKLSEPQKKCLLDYLEKNKEKYELESERIFEKCGNL